MARLGAMHPLQRCVFTVRSLALCWRYYKSMLLLADLDLGRHGWVRTVSTGTGYAAEVQTAASLALRCGAAMTAVSALARAATLKDGAEGIDPVTQTDMANEELVAAALRRQFPAHAIVGEESTAVLGRPNPNPTLTLTLSGGSLTRTNERTNE